MRKLIYLHQFQLVLEKLAYLQPCCLSIISFSLVQYNGLVLGLVLYPPSYHLLVQERKLIFLLQFQLVLGTMVILSFHC